MKAIKIIPLIFVFFGCGLHSRNAIIHLIINNTPALLVQAVLPTFLLSLNRREPIAHSLVKIKLYTTKDHHGGFVRLTETGKEYLKYDLTRFSEIIL